MRDEPPTPAPSPSDHPADALPGAAATIRFYLNGSLIEIVPPSPTFSVADFVRAPARGLTGTKIACGEGGCGACTVLLSWWDHAAQKTVHRAVHACLLPLCSLDGKALTTIEGLGSVRTHLRRIQHEIITRHGAQCGFCTPGWVMATYATLNHQAGAPCGAAEIMARLDGNLCRCTGYRPLLQAAAAVLGCPDPPGPALRCLTDPAFDPPISDELAMIPDELRQPTRPLALEQGTWRWYRPTTLVGLQALRQHYRERGRLLAGGYGGALGPANAAWPLASINITAVPELTGLALDAKGVRLGGAVTLADLVSFLETALQTRYDPGLAALARMAGRIGNQQLRNVASVAGNLITTLALAANSVPIISDLLTLLSIMKARVAISPDYGAAPTRELDFAEFVDSYGQSAVAGPALLLVSLLIPFCEPGDMFESWAIARRPLNAPPVANGALRVRLDPDRVIQGAQLAFGGIAVSVFRARQTELFLIGRSWSDETRREALVILAGELADLPGPALRTRLEARGIPGDYCRTIALTGAYKALMAMKRAVEGSDATDSQDALPLPDGKQHFVTLPQFAPLTAPYVERARFMHATGETRFLDDLPFPAGGLEAQFVYSQAAAGHFAYQWQGRKVSSQAEWMDFITGLGALFPGFVDLIGAHDLPIKARALIGYGNDDPLFCDDTVMAYGQPIALAVAESRQLASAAAAYIQSSCIVYEPLADPVTGEPYVPILSLEEAVAASTMMANPAPMNPALTHIEYLERKANPGAQAGEPLAPYCRLSGTQAIHGQMHFYLEPQTAAAIPADSDVLDIYASTQAPARVQRWVAHVLGLPMHRVQVHAPRVGGGFGGKTTRSAFVAAAVSVAAWQLKRPVRLCLPRATDALMVGKRHPFLGHYTVAFTRDGLIKDLQTELAVDAGTSYDNGPMVLDVALLAADNCYAIDSFRVSGRLYRTNTPSNTAMRGFGAFQSILIQEEAIERVAHELGQRPETIRELNLYADSQGDVAPRTAYGQALGDCNIRQLWHELKAQADFDQRSDEIARFNQGHRWRKRGISMIPVKYGKGFEIPTPNQAAATIDVYAADGSVLIHTGGIDLGQGLHAVLSQIAAQALNLPIDRIRIAPTQTAAIPNATTTGADSAMALNGRALAKACAALRARLEDFCQQWYAASGAAGCADEGINYWDYPQGWSATARQGNSQTLVWDQIVRLAYQQRVDLSARAHSLVPGISAVCGDPPMGTPFAWFSYSVSLVEVEIDVLTGEWIIPRADILHDVGQALNPAAVIGQLEGGFMQGLGALTTESLIYQRRGPHAGRLNTATPFSYAVPCAANAPHDLRISLAPGPGNRHERSLEALVDSAKPTGQTGVLLALPVFFAIKQAILSARQDRGIHLWVAFDAPATIDRIQTACLVDLDDLKDHV